MQSRTFRKTMYNTIVGETGNVVNDLIENLSEAVKDVQEELCEELQEASTKEDVDSAYMNSHVSTPEYNTTEKENLNMADSSLNATEIAVGSLLAGNRGGYGAGGGGAWGGGYGGVAPFAGPASNAVRLNRNEGVTRDATHCLEVGFSAGLDRISAQNLEGRANDRTVLLSKAISDAEFRSLDRQRDIERLINQNAKDAAACCCDVKVKAAEDKAELLAAIAAQGQATLLRELQAANDRVTQLTTIDTLSQRCGCCPS